MPTDVEKLYSAVKSGQIHPSKLNDEGKRALRDYIDNKQKSEAVPRQKTLAPQPSPREKTSSQQRADTLASAPKLIKPALGLVNKALDAYEQSPVGRFSERAGEAANNTRLMRNDLVKTTTGNKKADWVAENVGGLLGYVGPGSGALYSSAGRVLTSGVAKTLPRVAGALGAAGAATGATRGVVQGKDAKGIAKEAAIEGGLSAGGGALLHGAGKLVGKATTKLAENKVAKGKEALDLVNEAYAGAKVEKSAKSLRPLKPAEKVQPRVPDSEVYFGSKYGEVRTPDSPVALLPAGPSFKTNRYTINTPAPRVPGTDVFTVDQFGNTRTPGGPIALLPPGKQFQTKQYSMDPFIQKQAEQARQAYDEGITAIQNEYGHWDLRPQDVLPTAQKLGINLDELIAGLERAENPLTSRETLGNIANRSRMERVVGLKPVPNLTKPERLGYYGVKDQAIMQRKEIPIADSSESLNGLMGELAKKSSGSKANLTKPQRLGYYGVQNGAVMQNKGLTRSLPTVPTDRGVKLAPQLPKVEARTNLLPKLPKANTGANGGQAITPNGINPKELKDISGFQAYSTDVYRNFENVYGKKFPEIKKEILDPLDASKKDYIGFQQNWTDRLKTEVVDKLGITKGSKLSGLIQRYGEGGRKYFDKKKNEMVLEPYSLDDLKRDAPNDWQKVVEADNWFRKAYDGLIDEINVARQQIYPTNPGKLIPKRKDYYRHFQELEGLGGIKNIFETPANIDPNLVAVSEFTQPKSRFLGIAQKRGLGPYKEDAVGGFLNYIPSAAYAINIDKNIRNFAKLAGDLSKGTKDSKNLNNFINFLRKYSQDLAGKTNPIDRVVQEAIPGGRATFNAVRWLNSRVKANVVLGNASSAIAQLANVPQGIAFAKQHSAEGLVRALKSVVPSAGNPMNQSGFLAERYGGPGSSMYRQFDTKLIDQPKKMAAWVLETADKLGTNFVWNSAYSKAVKEKIADPIKFADENTRKLVAGRGVGEIPLLQKSQLTQVTIPFTLEVANLWRVQKDFLKGKDFTGLAVLYVANFLFNKVAEETRGSGVTFDPIQASLDAFPELKPLVGQEVTSKEQDMSPLQRGGRLVGEGLSNVPAGQYLASAYPEFGTEVFGKQLPTRKELFGRNDPTRFGTGLALVKGIQDPLYKLALPFGGGQLQKTKRGLDALQSQGVYSEDGTQLKYPIESNPANITKGLLFGPGGFKESQPYYDNDRRPLSENQTLLMQSVAKDGIDQNIVYDQLLLERSLNGIKDKVSEVQKDPKLSEAEKTKQINNLMAQGQSIIQKYEGGK